MTTSPAEPVASAAPGVLTGARAKALLAYIGLSGLLILGIWVAFGLAGSGVFDLAGHNVHDLDKQTGLDAHRAVGSILGLITILLLIAVGIARPGRKLIWTTVALFVLAGIGQPLFAGIGNDHPWGGGLHVLNAGVVLVLAFYCHLTSRKVPRA
jgi:uncharacterized protein DUF6220